MVDTKNKKIIWIVYVTLSFLLLFYTVKESLWTNFFSLDYLLLLATAIIVSFFPIKISDTVFSMVTGVSLITFVLYGFTGELLLTSIAVIILLLRVDLKMQSLHLYALNLATVMTLSVLSASAYHLTDLILAPQLPEQVKFIPLLAYITVYLFGNHFIYFLLEYFDGKKETPIFLTKQLVLSLMVNYTLLPFFYILIYLYYRIGSPGLQLGFIPYLTFVAGLYLWSKSELNNFYLQQVNEATHKLTERLNYEETIACFIDSLLEIFQAEQVYYYKVSSDDKMRLENVYQPENATVDLDEELYLPKDSLLAEVLESQSMTSYYHATDYMDSFGGAQRFKGNKAVIIPIYALNKNRGLILMVQPKNLLSEEYMESLIENFNRSFINVIENAMRYEKLKISNYTDGLTDLPNFRSFLKEAKKVKTTEEEEQLYSVIVLDIDHFKELNDRHGHEAGNDVLKQLGELLKRFSHENCFVARYGGEEFVLLVRNQNSEKTYQLAEEIRQAIENQIFIGNYSILENKEVELRITGSLGTATAPKDGNNVYDLIALADEAMYLGSKQNGRNKVTAYHQNL